MSKHNIYFVANYVGKPKNPRLTAQPGYMKDPGNMQLEEQIFIARGWREKFLRNSIVLDLTNEKVVKNSIAPGTPFADVFANFYSNYTEYIDNSVKELNAGLGIENSN